jgi:hypothetical protein
LTTLFPGHDLSLKKVQIHVNIADNLILFSFYMTDIPGDEVVTIKCYDQTKYLVNYSIKMLAMLRGI